MYSFLFWDEIKRPSLCVCPFWRFIISKYSHWSRISSISLNLFNMLICHKNWLNEWTLLLLATKINTYWSLSGNPMELKGIYVQLLKIVTNRSFVGGCSDCLHSILWGEKIRKRILAKQAALAIVMISIFYVLLLLLKYI